MQYYLGKIFGGESMTSYIKSKIQRSISFLIAMVIAFSVCSGVVLLNPTPSYAFSQADVDKALRGEKYLAGADLRGADLSGLAADLSGLNTPYSEYRGVNLFLANLIGANLIGANLIGARLAGAYLTGAYLIGANLSNADLNQAVLSNANLIVANLSNAGLTGADLTGAIADKYTKFPPGFDAKKAGVIIK